MASPFALLFVSSSRHIVLQLFDNLDKHAAHQRIIWHILCHHSPGGDNDIVANSHPRQDGTPAAYPNSSPMVMGLACPRCLRLPMGDRGCPTVQIMVLGPTIT